MALPHYPRKIKSLKNILKPTLKKESFFMIGGKIYINNKGYVYPAVKHPGQSTVTTGK